MSAAATVATIGHNSGASKLELALARTRELLASFARFQTAHPTIADEETQGNAADFVRQIKRCIAQLEAERKAEKQPHLDAERRIDRSYADIEGPLKSAAVEVEAKMTTFAREQERKRREAAQAEAKRRDEEAKRAEEAALAAAAPPAAMEQAIAAARDAEAAATIAAARPAELSRVHSDFGSVASLRETWTFELLDIKQVPAEFLQVNEVLVRRVIAGKSGLRAIPGLRIFPETKIGVR